MHCVHAAIFEALVSGTPLSHGEASDDENEEEEEEEEEVGEEEAVFQLPYEGPTAHLGPQLARVIDEEGSEGSPPQVLDDEDNEEEHVEANGFAARLSWNVTPEGDVLTGSVEDGGQSQKLPVAWEVGENSADELSKEEGSDEEETFDEWKSHNEIKQL